MTKGLEVTWIPDGPGDVKFWWAGDVGGVCITSGVTESGFMVSDDGHQWGVHDVDGGVEAAKAAAEAHLAELRRKAGLNAPS